MLLTSLLFIPVCLVLLCHLYFLASFALDFASLQPSCSSFSVARIQVCWEDGERRQPCARHCGEEGGRRSPAHCEL